MDKRMTRIEFTVPCVPVAQPRQRHRVVSRGSKSLATNYTPAKDPVNTFKQIVAFSAVDAYAGSPLEGPISMEIDFVFPRLKSTPKKVTGRHWMIAKPDRDNLEKSVQDCLNGILYRDDAQICNAVTRKLRCAIDEQPHVRIVIQTQE
jgi:Holliday junction resolvase RusA-like endonuclease